MIIFSGLFGIVFIRHGRNSMGHNVRGKTWSLIGRLKSNEIGFYALPPMTLITKFSNKYLMKVERAPHMNQIQSLSLSKD